MRCALGCLALVGFLLVGCGEPPPATPPGVPSGGSAPNLPSTPPNLDPGTPSKGSDPSGAAAPSDAGKAPAPAPGNSGAAADPDAPPAQSVEISPANTKITFVGTHAAPKAKDPRTGTFEKFSGKAEIDIGRKALKSVSVEIEVDSLKTFNPMLTTHLNSPDFFDTKQYPTAKFESTKIEAGQGGQHTVTGNLTLLKTTKEISFPLKVSDNNNAMNLNAEFEIDRLDFGIGVNQDGVERPVKIAVMIGNSPSGN
jgi:polyisoprenoid-binding protein YceI